MKNKRNYYRLLHVQFDAPAPVIKGSYRTMMQKMRLHPDLGGDEGNAQLLNEALATLLDPEKRAAYDLWLKEHQPESCKPRQQSFAAAETSAGPRSKASKAQKTAPDTAQTSTIDCAFCQFRNHRSEQQSQYRDGQNHLCSRCSAPLSRVDIEVSRMSGDARRLHRHLFNTGCEIQQIPGSPERLRAQVIDFSVLGLRIEHAGDLPAGQRVLIKCEKFACVACVSYSINEPAKKITSGLAILALDLSLSRGDLFTASY